MINRPIQNIVSKIGRFFILTVLFGAIFAFAFTYQAQAIDYPKLVNRSLRLGDTEPGVATDYTLSWRYPAPTTVGSIRFEICTNAFVEDVCTNPNADLSVATIGSQSGVTGFSILSQSTGEIIFTRPSAAASTVQSTYTLNGVINPDSVHAKFFIRISTYTSTDGSGQFNHFSSVASATADPIVINGEVPPILYFCAALTITEWCGNVSGNFIDYGDLSPIVTEVGTSQFGVATNAVGGYVVTVNGNTMAAGNKIIPELNAPAANEVGTGQFGINLRANTDPAAGQDASGEGIGTVDPGYDIPNQFLFIDGDTVASSVTGSLFNIFTVTYIVNIPPDQPSGVYNTTIAYICTAAF